MSSVPFLEGSYQAQIRNGHNVCVMVPGNSQRLAINTECVPLKAKQEHKQLVLWLNIDAPDQPLTDEEQESLYKIPPENTENIPKYGMFYEDMTYIIMDSDAPMLGRMKNNTAKAVMLLLDKNETQTLSPATASGAVPPVVFLKHPPVGIVVHPNGIDNRIKLHDPPIPNGCIVFQRQTTQFKFNTTTSITRTGIKLSPAFAVTDYFSQGFTVSEDKIFLQSLAFQRIKRPTKKAVMLP